MEKTLNYNKSKKEINFVNQLTLPLKKEILSCRDFNGMKDAILSMKLRGAPLIGVSGAFGLLLWCFENSGKYQNEDVVNFMLAFEKARDEMASVRPTAVNLKWACDKVYNEVFAARPKFITEIIQMVERLCVEMDSEDIAICEKIGRNGALYLKEKFKGRKLRILTHCNAGALATCGYGTALGVIRAAHETGILDYVWVDETRPYLQGARITAYELMEDKIDNYLICDNMAGFMMKKGLVDAVITGADRIAANGDAANKIGTYSLSVLAKENGVPMFIAAPKSTFDLAIKTGDDIKIEERSETEVTEMHGTRVAPHGVKVKNPAFDVTDAKYISGIITEYGVIEKPYKSNIKKALS